MTEHQITATVSPATPANVYPLPDNVEEIHVHVVWTELNSQDIQMERHQDPISRFVTIPMCGQTDVGRHGQSH